MNEWLTVWHLLPGTYDWYHLIGFPMGLFYKFGIHPMMDFILVPYHWWFQMPFGFDSNPWVSVIQAAYSAFVSDAHYLYNGIRVESLIESSEPSLLETQLLDNSDDRGTPGNYQDPWSSGSEVKLEDYNDYFGSPNSDSTVRPLAGEHDDFVLLDAPRDSFYTRLVTVGLNHPWLLSSASTFLLTTVVRIVLSSTYVGIM